MIPRHTPSPPASPTREIAAKHHRLAGNGRIDHRLRRTSALRGAAAGDGHAASERRLDVPRDDGAVIELLTARLRLRRWREADVDAMAAINADPVVMRWIGDGSVFDRVATAAEIAAFENVWQSYGFGRFAVEMRDTGELAGFTGMAIPEDVPDVMPGVEIGWRLGRPYWGRGLATEAAQAALQFAFTSGGLDRVMGIHIV